MTSPTERQSVDFEGLYRRLDEIDAALSGDAGLDPEKRRRVLTERARVLAQSRESAPTETTSGRKCGCRNVHPLAPPSSPSDVTMSVFASTAAAIAAFIPLQSNVRSQRGVECPQDVLRTSTSSNTAY